MGGGTEFQEISLRPNISVVYTLHAICPLRVTSVQLMTPGIGRNTPCALGDFHFLILGLCDIIWLFAAKGVVVLSCMYIYG